MTAAAAAQPAENEPPLFVGTPAAPRPIDKKSVLQNPFLAPQSSGHFDTYNSNVTDLPTPLGKKPLVQFTQYDKIAGTCLNFMFDDAGRLFALCGVFRQGSGIDFELAALNPNTLEKIDSVNLGQLPGSNLPVSLSQLILDDRGRNVGVLDERGRFVTVDISQRVNWIGLGPDGKGSKLVVQEQYDLSALVPTDLTHVSNAALDYEGRLVFMAYGGHDSLGAPAGRPALLGVVDRQTKASALQDFPGEFFEHGFVIGQDGIFLVSDRALYGFHFDAQAQKLEPLFREEYTRGTERTGGVLSWGSGSTPTLVGDHLIAITDSADQQIDLLVYDRRKEPPNGRRLVCKVPLFAPGASANENSVVATGRSLIVQNWFGAVEELTDAKPEELVGGVVRIDVREDEGGCDEVWNSPELKTRGSLKLSTATGLIYGSMLDDGAAGAKGYYARAIDFRTGRAVYGVRVGIREQAEIFDFPLYAGPDGALYQPSFTGVLRFGDKREEADRLALTSLGCAMHSRPRSPLSLPSVLFCAAALSACAWRPARRWPTPTGAP